MKNLIVSISLLFISYNVLIAQSEYKDSVQQLRVLQAAELIDPVKSTLSSEERDQFQGLDFYQIDSTARIVAKLEKNIGKNFKMATSTNSTQVYRRYGYVYFDWKSEKCTLTVYQNIMLTKREEFNDYLFIPFKDLTSREETYGGGRYLDLKIPDSKEILIDFNLAYNPYCAYSIRYSCPIPPEENNLKVKIEAGEKNPLEEE